MNNITHHDLRFALSDDPMIRDAQIKTINLYNSEDNMYVPKHNIHTQDKAVAPVKKPDIVDYTNEDTLRKIRSRVYKIESYIRNLTEKKHKTHTDHNALIKFNDELEDIRSKSPHRILHY